MHNNTISKKVLFVLCVVILVAGFIHSVQKTEQSLPKTIQPQNDNKVYVDDQYHFSFEYPKELEVSVGSEPGVPQSKSISFFCPIPEKDTSINTDNIYIEEGTSAEESRLALQKELKEAGVKDLPTLQLNNAAFNVYDQGTIVRYINEKDGAHMRVVKLYDGGEECGYKHILLETFRFTQ